jgi:glycosyltransferase involved in cell wall biosynthesis
MGIPFFSIVIPTKNRPRYLYDAIYSALNQDFKNVEVIVSDNFNDEQTLQTVHQFKENPRLKYFRTPHEMNMLDHWEWATLKATGEYVVVLPDRKVLYKNGLQHLFEQLRKYAFTFNHVSYGVRQFDEQHKRMGWRAPLGKSGILSADFLIRDFLNTNYFSTSNFDVALPKTLNSCYKNQFAQEIRTKYGGYFNIPGVVTPDYSSCFINLAHATQILYLATPVILTQGEAISNGRNFGNGNYQPYLDSLGITKPYEFAPVHAPFIYSLLVGDFGLIKQLMHGNLSGAAVNMENILAVTKIELDHKKASGVASEEVLAYFQQALDAVRARDPQIAERADQLYHTYINQKGVESSFINHVRDFIHHRFTHIHAVNLIFKYRFDSTLQAAGYSIK